jgi:hypothetical protein
MSKLITNRGISGIERNDLETINYRSLQEFQELAWVRSKQKTGIPQLLERATTNPELNIDGLTNLTKCLGVMHIIQNNTGENSSYPDEVPFIMSEAMIPAIMMHDVVFSPTVNRRNQSLSVFDSNFVDEYVALAASNGQQDTQSFAAGLCYAASVRGFETKSKLWRGLVLRTCDDRYLEDDKATSQQLLELVNSKHNRGSQFDLVNIKDQITQALTSPTSEISDVLLNYRAPLSDIRTNIEAVSNYDIEGLLIRASEVVFNLQKPRQSNGIYAKDWCYAQELLSYYGPMLEMAGFKKLSDLCYSSANEYLHQNEPNILRKARTLHENAQLDWDEVAPIFTGMFQGMGGFTVDGNRVKSIGSIAHKIATHDNMREVPDLTAMMLTADHTYHENEDMHNGVSQVLATLEYKLGCQIANPNKDTPPIDVKWDNLPRVENSVIIFNGREYHVHVQPRTIDSYEGINISAITPNGTPLEVQIHDKKSAAARIALANHTFYNIGKNGSGPLATQRSELRQVRNELAALAPEDPKFKALRKSYETRLNKFEELKSQLLESIEERIRKRVNTMGQLEEVPQANPRVLAKLIGDHSLNEDTRGLLANMAGELTDLGNLEP